MTFRRVIVGLVSATAAGACVTMIASCAAASGYDQGSRSFIGAPQVVQVAGMSVISYDSANVADERARRGPIHFFDGSADSRVGITVAGRLDGGILGLDGVANRFGPDAFQGDPSLKPGVVVATEAATVRHYTTSEFAESISKQGEITPGLASGKKWLTPDHYLDGATARSKLALNKTPDGCFEIPMCRVSCPSSPSRVDPYHGQPGGGTQITTDSPIDVSGLPFVKFGSR